MSTNRIAENNAFFPNGKTDAFTPLVYFERFLAGMNISRADIGIYPGSIDALVEDANAIFEGNEHSVFKQVASFTMSMIINQPVECNLPKKYGITAQWVNEILAFHYSIDALYHAKIKKDGGVTDVLANPIKISHHSFADLMHAFSELRNTSPENLTGPVMLIASTYEAFAYRANPLVSYKPIVVASCDFL